MSTKHSSGEPAVLTAVGGIQVSQSLKSCLSLAPGFPPFKGRSKADSKLLVERSEPSSAPLLPHGNAPCPAPGILLCSRNSSLSDY